LVSRTRVTRKVAFVNHYPHGGNGSLKPNPFVIQKLVYYIQNAFNTPVLFTILHKILRTTDLINPIFGTIPFFHWNGILFGNCKLLLYLVLFLQIAKQVHPDIQGHSSIWLFQPATDNMSV
jgi:hypothetical protein